MSLRIRDAALVHDECLMVSAQPAPDGTANRAVGQLPSQRPAPNKRAAMLVTSVAEYDIADVRSLLEKT